MESTGERNRAWADGILRRVMEETVDGEYQPPGETQGRKVALEKLVTDLVDGAQSQW